MSIPARCQVCVVLVACVGVGCTSRPTERPDEAPSAKTVSPTITAYPNPVPPGVGAGTTTITWNTGDASTGQVYVSFNGGAEQLFAGESTQGSQAAAWIGTARTYEFRLYRGTERRQRLAAVKVERSREPILSATPNPVPPGRGPGSTRILWNTGDGLTGEVYVSVDGGQEVLFTRAPEGSQDAPWIGAGSTYEFRLYAGTNRAKLLRTVRVLQAATRETRK